MTKTKKSTPLVSVIMNCHNGEKFLEKSINSVIQQTYQNWELIFFDNFSTDESKKIVNGYVDKRIKYFKSNNFTSLYEARNLAIQKAEGDYISFIDTDDLWVEDKLKKQIDFLEKNKEFKIVYSNYYILEDKKNKKYLKHKKSLHSGQITQKLLDNYSLGILTAFLEKDIFKKFEFKKNYNIIGDFDFFIDLSQKFKIGSIQEPLALYRVHESNFSIKRINLHIQELSEWIKTNEKKFLSFGYSLKKQKSFLLKLKIKFFFMSFFKF